MTAPDMTGAPPGALDNVQAAARAFMQARIVLTAAELDLFSALSASPIDAATLARQRGLGERPLAMLLDALSALGFLEKSEGRYRCPEPLVPYLSAGTPTTVLPMLLHQARLWETWSGLTRIISPRLPPNPDSTRSFIGAMHVVAASQAPRIVAAIEPGRARRLLDVGGASGSYTLAFLAANPDLQATLFDRPEVIPLAEERLRLAGQAARVALVSGDFTCDALPKDHDLAFLSAVIHSCSREEMDALFRNVAAALVPGGRIVIRDFVMSEDRTSPAAGAVFAINMLVNTAGGGTYTRAEIQAGLEGAGFERVRQLAHPPTMDALIEAYKPDTPTS